MRPEPPRLRRSTAEELLAAATFGIPERAASYVPRPRLTDALARAEDLPLVLVCGPAGTGKTSLVAEWARDTRIRDRYDGMDNLRGR